MIAREGAAAKKTTQVPKIRWISGAQTSSLNGPVAGLRHTSTVGAVASPAIVRARRSSMRSYSGTEAVK